MVGEGHEDGLGAGLVAGMEHGLEGLEDPLVPEIGLAFDAGTSFFRVPGRLQTDTLDDYCYNIVEDPVHIRDMNATILNQMGIDHNRLTFRYQGLDQKLTGAEPARVVDEILA